MLQSENARDAATEHKKDKYFLREDPRSFYFLQKSLKEGVTKFFHDTSDFELRSDTNESEYVCIGP